MTVVPAKSLGHPNMNYLYIYINLFILTTEYTLVPSFKLKLISFYKKIHMYLLKLNKSKTRFTESSQL